MMKCCCGMNVEIIETVCVGDFEESPTVYPSEFNKTEDIITYLSSTCGSQLAIRGKERWFYTQTDVCKRICELLTLCKNVRGTLHYIKTCGKYNKEDAKINSSLEHLNHELSKAENSVRGLINKSLFSQYGG